MADNCKRCQRLERQNQQLRQRIQRAQQICAHWHNECVKEKRPVDAVLSTNGHPPEVYGYNKGAAGGLQLGIAGLSEVYHALEE